MMNVTVNIDDKGALSALERGPSNIIRRRGEALAQVGAYIQVQALKHAYANLNKRTIPTGRLASSIMMNVNAAQGFARVYTTGYKKGKWDIPAVVEYGQRSHKVNGRQHPGARGKFFMNRAGIEGAIYAEKRFGDKVRLAMRDSGFK